MSEGQRAFDAGDFEKAASTGRAVLAANPQHAKANLLVGQASLRTQRFADSETHLARAIDLGESVELQVKHRHLGGLGLRESFCDGLVTLTREVLSYRSLSTKSHDFSVEPAGILEAKMLQFRIDMRIAIKNGTKVDRKNFDFVHPGMVRVNRDSASLITELRCATCDESMNIFFSLLEKIRGAS
jgi:hypothetical protein